MLIKILEIIIGIAWVGGVIYRISKGHVFNI